MFIYLHKTLKYHYASVLDICMYSCINKLSEALINLHISLSEMNNTYIAILLPHNNKFNSLKAITVSIH